MALTLKWSEINDDDINGDEFVGFVTTVGDIKISTTFSDEVDGTVKIITKSKIITQFETKSRLLEKKKRKMREQKINDDLHVIGEEVFIELPKSLRKLEDDNDACIVAQDRESGGLLLLRKDGIKEKFQQLKLLDANTNISDERGLISNVESHRNEKDDLDDFKYSSGRGKLTQKDYSTVRVTNLSEDTKEEDLQELFGKAGKISRVYLAKDKETKSSKGFAFITYEDRQSAEKAIKNLDRHGYDSLLLKVEWAKPSLKGRD